MEEKKDLTQELERIKAELEELKKKLGMAEEKSLRELPTEALSKVMEVSKEIDFFKPFHSLLGYIHHIQ